MSRRSTLYIKGILIVSLFAFLSFGFFGISHFSMGEMGGMPTSNCPLMPGMTSVCNMNPLEHVAAWQSMFTSVPAQKTFGLMLLFLLAFLSARALVAKIKWTFEPPQNHMPLPQWARNQFIPRYALQEAFSNGIIHSKIFLARCSLAAT